MKLRSLGLRTDMMFHRAGATVIDRGDHLVIKTPDNPVYFFGNLLLLDRAPRCDELTRWEGVFADAFADQPESSHRSFMWDHGSLEQPASEDAIAAFEAAGYDYEKTMVLATDAVNEPPHPNRQVAIRPITTEVEWEAVRDLQVLTNASRFDPESYGPFFAKRMAKWRCMVDGGRGVWLGAFERTTLVADCGLFWEEGIGRFQAVETRASHRRRGICGTLVHHGCRLAFEQKRVRDLVMEADEDYQAARVYESLGFRPAERLGSLCRYDKARWDAKNSATGKNEPGRS